MSPASDASRGSRWHRAAGTGVLAALLFLTPAVAAEEPESPHAVCNLQPRVLDVSRAPGPLVGRIELFSANGLSALDPRKLGSAVHVSSVGGMPLPAPSDQREGIEENPSARRFEDGERAGVPGTWSPNGIVEAVVSFDRSADGDARTRGDGDAGDVLAMLLDVPDGESAEICLTGSIEGVPFSCCDSVTVRNRGLRDLPGGLFPEVDEP